MLDSVRNNTFWDKIGAKNVLFDTDSNEDFFNYVMHYFKDDKILYYSLFYFFVFVI